MMMPVGNAGLIEDRDGLPQLDLCQPPTASSLVPKVVSPRAEGITPVGERSCRGTLSPLRSQHVALY